MARARAADDALAHGEWWGPFHGVPCTVKDTFETAGMTTTAGAPSLAKHVPARDAALVERLRAAGAIIVGKTNVPIYAGDGQTFNKVFGATNNPHDVTRSPGGSSGGAAAALAAGLTYLEIGSDLAGSIRAPRISAAFMATSRRSTCCRFEAISRRRPEARRSRRTTSLLPVPWRGARPT